MALPSPSAGTEQLGCHIRAAPFPFLRAVPADCSPCCLWSRLHVVLHTRCFVGHLLPPHGPPEPGRARGFGRSFHPMASCCSHVSAESSLSPDFHAPRPFTEDPQWQLRPRVSAVSGQLRAGPCASCLLLGRIASLVRLRWPLGLLALACGRLQRRVSCSAGTGSASHRVVLVPVRPCRPPWPCPAWLRVRVALWTPSLIPASSAVTRSQPLSPESAGQGLPSRRLSLSHADACRPPASSVSPGALAPEFCRV